MSALNSIIYKLKQLLKSILPSGLLNLARKTKRLSSSHQRSALRKNSRLITDNELTADLKSAGFAEGDLLMVHSSLSRIGNIEGGPEAIIRAFIKTVGPTGTIIMPAYNSAQDAVKKSESGNYVDLRNSKSAVGKITEAFRNWPEVRRSSHPFSSSCTWGALANKFSSDHESNCDVCHLDSPVGKLVSYKGKVVGVGVPIAQGLGVAHYIEDTWDQFPFEVHSEEFEITYIDIFGKERTRNVRRYDPKVTRTRVDYPDGAWIHEKLTSHFSRIGLLKPFKFGEADSWIMDAADLAKELKRLASKGVTMYLTENKLTDQNRNVENW